MVSINTNISALYSQSNLNRADSVAQSSIARLSSGQRIIRAADDAAGLAVGTGLRTDVSTLRTALTNTSQANSVLQIADGALQNIGEILQRQKALASQANSGSLSATERAFLNQEFQNLANEIDRISSTTNFNGITLLDGGLFDNTEVESIYEGTKATGTIALTQPADNDTIIVNGVTFTFQTAGTSVAATDVDISAVDAEGTLNNLLAALRNSTNPALTMATYEKVGTGTNAYIRITAKEAGNAGNSFTLAAGTGSTETFSGATLAGGTNSSLSAGRTSVTGTVGDNILNARAGVQATRTMTVTNAADNATFNINGTVFTIQNTAGYTGAYNEVLLGTTAADTAANIVNKLNSSTIEGVAKATYSAAGAVITATYKTVGTEGNSYFFIDTASNVMGTGTTNTNYASGGTIGGVDVTGIANNSSFTGTISGITATYNGSPDQLTLKVTVGDYEYTATVTDTTVAADTFVTFSSVNNAGGSFRLELDANNGTSVNNQTQADLFANRLNTALSTLTMYQERDVVNFQGVGDIFTGTTKTGTLTGASLDLKAAGFSNLNIDSVTVTAPKAGNSNYVIEMVINGETFKTPATTSTGILSGTRVTLTSEDDPNKTIVFQAGGSPNVAAATLGTNTDDIMISTDAQAAAFQAALEEALGLGQGGGGLEFQVGIASDDTINVSLEGTGTSSLYEDADGVAQSLDVTTAENAVTAGDILDLAINRVTTLRANIGALQSRFDFAAANIETSIQNTDAARADFLDADISEESTTFAQAQVRIQASISVLAQANQLPQSLLKLIG